MSKITEFGIALIASIAIFTTPIHGVLLIVGLFISLDTIFGLWASWKLKKPILSKKLGRMVAKMFTYEIVVLLFFCIDVFIFREFRAQIGLNIQFFLTKILGLSLIGLELFSIDEKLRQVNGKGLRHYFKKLVSAGKLLKKNFDDFQG